jgi:hypothetical protein
MTHDDRRLWLEMAACLGILAIVGGSARPLVVIQFVAAAIIFWLAITAHRGSRR